MKKNLFLLMFSVLSISMGLAQTITGKVEDSQGPLAGVSILVKNTTIGVITDFNGNYTIDADVGKTLVYSYIGYKSVEIQVSNQNIINVTLEEDAQNLDEVVLSALGFKENRDNLASTYSKLDSQDVVRSGEPNLINGLSGKASGVIISATSADPGAGSNIQIRGASSIIGQTQPLIVIDGIPVNNDNFEGFGSDSDGGISQQSRLNDINPNDIASIQVFKGASAGAIYGSKALGGVIVITTKRGATGKMKVSLSTNYSMDQINVKHAMQSSYGQGSNGKYSPTAANSWGDRISERAGGEDTVKTTGEYFLGSNGVTYYPITKKNSTNIYTDSNFDAVFQNGHSKNTQLSLSGGNEKGSYYMSLNQINQEGIMKNSNYDKTSITLATTNNFTPWLKNSSKVIYSTNYSNRIQQGSNTAGIYLGLLRNPADFDISGYIGTYYDNNGNPTENRHRSYRRYLGNSSSPTYNNPLWTVNEQTSDTSVDRFIASTDFNITATDWWNIVLRTGLDQYQDDRVYFYPMFSADGATNGRYQNETFVVNDLNAEAISSMNFSLKKDLNMNLIFGAAINKSERKQTYLEAVDFLYNTRLVNPAIAATKINEERNRNFRSIRSYIQSKIQYKDYLNLNLGATYEDASSSSKSFIYPSAEFGFNWAQLISTDLSKGLSFGKLRLAYGEVGLPPGAHLFQTTYENASYSSYSDAVSLDAFGGGFRLNDDKGNAELEFEKKREYELGIDLRFFRNRLSLSGTVYRNETRDALLNLDLNPSEGFNSIYKNAGTIENKGLEVEFSYDLFKGQDFNMSVFGNVFTNKNKVLDLSGVSSINLTVGSSIKSSAVVGQPLGILLGSAALRDAQGNLDLDANGFPQLDPSGDKVIGDPNPDWRGSIGLHSSYKNFSLDIAFDTSQGNEIGERTRYVLYGFGTHSDVGNTVTPSSDLKNYAGATIPAGVPVRGNIMDYGAGPVLLDEKWYTTLGGGFGGSVINEFAIGDASYVRLRELTAALNLTGNWIKKLNLESVKLNVTGRNLALWTDLRGIDPDVNQFGNGNGKGLDYFTNPSSKSILFGLNINY